MQPGVEVNDSITLTAPRLAAPPRNLRFAVLLALIFFITSLPVLPLLSRYRGDEGFYTNAAIRMVQTGNYLTPYYAQGEPRFNKPILNYWLIALNFKLLGIGEFSARLAQLVAGTLALLAVYRLARVLFEDRRVALAAVALLLTNEQVLNTSVRATTDVVQFFFLTVALTGLAAIIFRASRAPLDYLLAFGGLGLAMLTKGALSLLVLAFAAGFAIYHARRTRAPVGKTLRALLPIWGILLMLLPTAIWMAMNVAHYGSMAIRGLWSDQVGDRLESGGGLFWQNILAYGSAPFIDFLPWTIALVLLAFAGREQLRGLLARRRQELLFSVGFFVTCFLMLIFANITRTRYVLPVYPLIASAAAYLIIALADQAAAAQRTAHLLSQIAAILAAVFALALAAIMFHLPNFIPGYAHIPAFHPLLLPLLLLIVSLILLWKFRSKTLAVSLRVAGVAILLVMAYRFADLGVRSHLFTVGAPGIIEAVQTQTPASSSPAQLAIVGSTMDADQIRLVSAGTLRVEEFPASATVEELRAFPAVLFPIASTLDLGPNYHAVLVPPRTAIWRPTDLFRLATGSVSLEKLRTIRQTSYTLLIRTTTPSANHGTIPP